MTTYQRRLWLLSDDEPWCLQQAARLSSCCKTTVKQLVLGGSDDPPLLQLLGREYGLLIFNAHQGFDPDYFAAATGTIIAGGMVLLLTPPLAEWGEKNDAMQQRISVAGYPDKGVTSRYLLRLATELADRCQPFHFNAQQPPPPLSLHLRTTQPGSEQQRQLLPELLAHLNNPKARWQPLVLIADRGRGKSALLGMVAAAYLQQDSVNIILTAPTLAATTEIFNHALRCKAERLNARQLRWQHATLSYLPPDQLLAQKPGADLLLIDEAAAIPPQLLIPLLSHYPYQLLTTTVHGYEGSGRGFIHRFKDALDKETPGWRQFSLTTPIRWLADDPLESLVNHLLLLNATAVATEQLLGFTKDSWQITEINRDLLWQQPAKLHAIFGLLLEAHYRTTALDLRQLLDGPNVRIIVICWQERVVGVALLADEGALVANASDPLAAAIIAGKRRPRGHLLPQIIASQRGVAAALTLPMRRIIRIAIHPQLQRQGLGSSLLKSIIDQAARDGCAAIGTTFGVSLPLLNFWQQSGFTPIHLGERARSASGSYALTLLHPLTASGEAVLQQAVEVHQHQLPEQLGDLFAHESTLDPAIAIALLRLAATYCRSELTTIETLEINAFANGERSYNSVIATLRDTAMQLFCLPDNAQNPLLMLVLLKVLARKPWHECCQRLAISGQRQGLAQLRQIYRSVIH
ncbi:MAG: tRNA(Met) cytidine acetyltransferase [Gammaproteobacteria bacterium]|nr:tRNA(Met) cytidine acetyltransferase [Gammaproteobacteria bacterium]